MYKYTIDKKLVLKGIAMSTTELAYNLTDRMTVLQLNAFLFDTYKILNNEKKLLTLLGFMVRINGDYFIYTKDDVEEIINIQPKGNKAKPYQVKQVRNIILKYRMGGTDHV